MRWGGGIVYRRMCATNSSPVGLVHTRWMPSLLLPFAAVFLLLGSSSSLCLVFSSATLVDYFFVASFFPLVSACLLLVPGGQKLAAPPCTTALHSSPSRRYLFIQCTTTHVFYIRSTWYFTDGLTCYYTCAYSECSTPHLKTSIYCIK